MDAFIAQAISCLERAKAQRPAPWIGHSYAAGMAAYLLARRMPGMDAGLACACGLLHDIGRALGPREMQINHIFLGYRFLLQEGYPKIARVALTHSFPVQDIRSVTGVWDCTEEDRAFLERYLQEAVYDPYDKLIQFCDNVALPEGIVVLERRLVDVVRRYGLDAENLLDRWERLFAIREEIEAAMGTSVDEALGLSPTRPVPERFWAAWEADVHLRA